MIPNTPNNNNGMPPRPMGRIGAQVSPQPMPQRPPIGAGGMPPNAPAMQQPQQPQWRAALDEARQARGAMTGADTGAPVPPQGAPQPIPQAIPLMQGNMPNVPARLGSVADTMRGRKNFLGY